MAKIRAKKRSNEHESSWLMLPVLARVGIAALFGVAVTITAYFFVSVLYLPLIFWDTTALIAAAGLWISVRNMDAKQTEAHATVDDPGRGIADVIMLFASIASLAAVLVLVIKAGSASGLIQILDISLGVVSVIVSWSLVHLIFMLRYADLYFNNPSCIDFNTKEKPTYQDFAYVAFTIGMTYQVSDTSFSSTELRKVARRHAILSYVFGTAIIATVINTIAGLGK